MFSRFPFLLREWHEMGLHVHGRVLDLGCMNAALPQLLRHMMREYVGVDLNTKSVRSAHAKNPDYDFICCDIRSLPFQYGTFDLIFAVSIFEHIRPEILESVLRRISSLLRNRGNLIIQIPNSRFIIELHSKIPFFHYFPKRVQDWLMPKRDFYDLKPKQIANYLIDIGSFEFRKYRYPPEVTHLPSFIKVPIPMGFLFLFTPAQTSVEEHDMQ